jgi:hypothetical protein
MVKYPVRIELPMSSKILQPSTCWRTGNASALFVLLALNELAGCGKSLPPRAVASGTVTFKGKPVEFGDIVFDLKQGDTGGLFAQGKITGGKYSFDVTRGPLVGENIVRIYGYKMTGRKRLDLAGKSLSEAPEMVNELMPYIPEKFNEASELTVEIKPGENSDLNIKL